MLWVFAASGVGGDDVVASVSEMAAEGGSVVGGALVGLLRWMVL